MLVTEEENQPSKQHPNTNTPKTLLKIKIKIRITIFFHAKTTKTAIASGHIGKPHQCEKCLFKKTQRQTTTFGRYFINYSISITLPSTVYLYRIISVSTNR